MRKLLTTVPAIALACAVSAWSATGTTYAAFNPGRPKVLEREVVPVAKRAPADDEAETVPETKKAAKKPETRPSAVKKLPLIEQRRRAAEQQRLLLQERAARSQNTASQQQLERLREQQAERLRQQEDQQRRSMYQTRRLEQPSVNPSGVPRLTPLDRPLYDQTHPSCGVRGMPLC